MPLQLYDNSGPQWSSNETNGILTREAVPSWVFFYDKVNDNDKFEYSEYIFQN